MAMHMESRQARERRGGLWPWSRRTARADGDEPEYLSYGPLYDEDGPGDPEFGAWYAQLGWVLTGESRRYNIANASYQNPQPYMNVTSQGGIGAWELALRFSHTDLDFHEGDFGSPTPADGIRGGVQDIWTLGLNWYLNATVRITANWLNVDVDRLNPSPTAFGPARASVGYDHVTRAVEHLDRNASPKIVADWIALSL